MCTLLHSSLKNCHIAPNEQNNAFALVEKELLKRTLALDIADITVLKAVTTTVSITIDTTASILPNNLLSRCFAQPRPIAKPISTPINELNDYMSFDVQIHEHDDILLFWKKMRIISYIIINCT